MKRRRLLQGLMLAPLAGCFSGGSTGPDKAEAQSLSPERPLTMMKRPIPSTGEEIPVVGLGTYRSFDHSLESRRDEPLRDRLVEVLRKFAAAGGRVIDTSPMYGYAESVLGDLLPRVDLPLQEWFLATKVWTDGEKAGARQIADSMDKIGLDPLDLIQIHNLRSWKSHLPTLRSLKEQGRVRYVGATTYGGLLHEEMAGLMREGHLDFIQLSYNVAQRKAEQTLLPLAEELGVAVIVNRPFGQGSLFARVADAPLPEWAKQELGCHGWGGFFLKFILAHPAVTTVIPATSNPRHLAENVAAGGGALPSAAQREQMIELMERLGVGSGF